MRKLLVRNSTTYGHVDYNVPISVHKSTDFRTTTGTNHRYIPPFPQDFDARINLLVPSVKDPIFKDEFYLSNSQRSYRVKRSARNPMDPLPAQHLHKLIFLKGVEEKIFKNPPRPIAPVETECKEAYARKSVPRDPFVPAPLVGNQLCEMRAFGRDEQPPLRPDESGCTKHLDIYLSTSRASYIPYSKRKQDGIGKKDIITFYDASGVPRGGKGYGPNDSIPVKTLTPKCRKYDDQELKSMAVHHPIAQMKFCSKTEYQNSYQEPTRSDFYPFIFELGVPHKGVAIAPSKWQNLAASGMYCTESCHIGTGYPIRAVVEVKTPQKEYTHNICSYCDCINL